MLSVSMLQFFVACSLSVIHEGSIPGYRDVPRVTVADPDFFRDLLKSSGTRVVRGVMFGDSQETSPWGWGMHYVPFLNARFAQVFGPCSESMLLTNVDMVERPQWLATVARAACAEHSGSIPSSAVLPGLIVDRLSPGCPLGAEFRAVLLHDASRAVDPTLQGGPWMVDSPTHQIDILAVVGNQGAELAWAAEPTDGDNPSPQPAVAAGTFVLPPADTGAAFRWATSPPVSRGARRHLQVSIRPSGRGAIDFVGLRFRDPASARGVVLQSLSKGGQRLVDLTGNHGESAAMLRAIDPTFVVIHLGANDAMEMSDPELWAGRLEAAISWIRGAVGDPRFPVLIASDLRGGVGGLPFSVIDRMPAIAHQFAERDDRILAINLRRICEEEFLWGETQHYLADGAHFQPYAQRLLAVAFVGELCEVLGIPDSSCGTGASWSDCVPALGSACVTGGCRRMLEVESEQLGVNWSRGTACVDFDGDGYPDECPSRGPADIDRDGLVGGSDLGILLGVWGTGSPAADLDADGTVGGADLGLMLAAWSAP